MLNQRQRNVIIIVLSFSWNSRSLDDCNLFLVDLSEALTSAESIQGLLDDPSLVSELSPHLPEVNNEDLNTDRLRSTLQSPQFQQVRFWKNVIRVNQPMAATPKEIAI